MTLVTSYRQAVAAAASSALGIDFVDGRIEGPIRDRDLGCTYPGGTGELDDHVEQRNITVLLRVFLRYDRSEEPEAPIDPAPLEAAADTLEQAISQIQVQPGGIWFCRITTIDFDMDRNSLEATVVGWDANRFGGVA